MDNIRMNYGTSSLLESVGKFAVLFVSLMLGLFFGLKDSYQAFYITVLIQSMSNFYDAAEYLSGYRPFIAVSNLIVCIVSVVSLVFSAMYLAGKIDILSSTPIIIVICIFLSLPLILTCVQMYMLIRDGKY